MKPRSFKPSYLLVGLLVTASTLALISWNRHEAPGQHQTYSPNDTTPKKNVREKKVRDLDEAIDNLDNLDLKATIDQAMKSVNEAMKSIDMQKIQAEVKNAMKDIDMDKIREQINTAMKEVDVEKIQREVKESLSNINWDDLKKEMAEAKDMDLSKTNIDMKKIQETIDNAMKSVDMQKIQEQINASMSNIDWDKIKKDVDEAKNIDLSKMEIDLKKMNLEMEKLGPKIEEEMKKAKVQIEKAKVDLKDYKELVDGLDKDGLLNKKEPYTLVHKDGQLLINGKQVSAQTYDKYRSVLKKHETFTIKKDKDDFNINAD
ncbi:MAG: hypothetical protein ABI480_03660 [Chitinophagaceae bacterium]